MRGFRPLMVMVIQIFPQAHLIPHLKFDQDSQSLRHKTREMVLFVGNQTFKDLSVCLHSVSVASPFKIRRALAARVGESSPPLIRIPTLFVLSRSATTRSSSSWNCSTHSAGRAWWMGALAGNTQ